MSLVSSQELGSRRPRITLNGRWAFTYDPKEQGIEKRWFAPGHVLPERIAVPGCPQARRYASAGDSEKGDKPYIPELSMTILLRHPCMAPSWWKRAFVVPREWKGRRVWLCLGGVCPAVELWINGRHHGSTITSRSPVRCDITQAIHHGETNELTLRLEWPKWPEKLRLDGMWNCTVAWSGIYRSVWIEATEAIRIDDIQAIPTLKPPSARLNVAISPGGARLRGLRLEAEILPVSQGVKHSAPYRGAAVVAESASKDGCFAVDIPMPEAETWTIENPRLYTARVRLFMGDSLLDEAETRFGLREVTTRGFQVLLNGTPVFLRGGCDDQLYPATVCPPEDKEFYRRRIRLAKQYGFNYTKSCVGVFTREFLEAADEEGYLVCQEMPFGLMGAIRNARYEPDARLRAMHKRELGNIVRHSRNHPSVILYSMASELGNQWRVNKASFRHFSCELPAMARVLAPRVLVADCTGESGVLVNGWIPDNEPVACKQPHGLRNTDLQCGGILWPAVPIPFFGKMPGLNTVSRPYIYHEYCWITSLSDPGLMRRFARLPIKPLMIPEMVALARRNGQAQELPAMLKASRKLKLALRKHALEMARTSVKAAGYHHWLIQDFVYAAEGVFNEFWEAPADLSGDEFRQCNGDIVLCLDDGGQRCFINGETVPMGVLISHFGVAPLRSVELRWRLLESGRLLAGGRQKEVLMIPSGSLHAMPLEAMRLPGGSRPRALIYEARLYADGGLMAENRWRLWSVPAPAKELKAFTTDETLAAESGVTVRKLAVDAAAFPGRWVRIERKLTDEFIAWLAAGGRGLFLGDSGQREAGVDLPRAAAGDAGFMYRTVPYNMGSQGNMGTVIHNHHALGGLPHDGWCDFVFQPLLEGAAPVALAPFKPLRIKPIVRSIGHMATMDDKAYLFEIGVGRGRLLVCSLYLSEEKRELHCPSVIPPNALIQEPTPAARYLLSAMVAYLNQDRLTSAARIAPQRLRAIRC